MLWTSRGTTDISRGGPAMKRLVLLLCLATVTGCASDKAGGSLSDAMKDWRGDNMRMQSWPADGLSSNSSGKIPN
jgi:hypothetical protein